MKAEIYNKEGQSVGKIDLPKQIFEAKWKADLVHKVVTAMLSNARHSTAHTKDRGDVSGGGKKPWRQKGTGRARHGSTRSPIWVGGGVSHGPIKEKNYSRKLNKKEKAKALSVVLSKKLRDGEILFVDALDFKAPKTKEAKEVLEKLGKVSGFEGLISKRKNAAFLALDQRSENVEKSFRNFGNIEVDEIRNINPVSLLQNKYLIILNPKTSLEKISDRI